MGTNKYTVYICILFGCCQKIGHYKFQWLGGASSFSQTYLRELGYWPILGQIQTVETTENNWVWLVWQPKTPAGSWVKMNRWQTWFQHGSNPISTDLGKLRRPHVWAKASPWCFRGGNHPNMTEFLVGELVNVIWHGWWFGLPMKNSS